MKIEDRQETGRLQGTGNGAKAAAASAVVLALILVLFVWGRGQVSGMDEGLAAQESEIAVLESELATYETEPADTAADGTNETEAELSRNERDNRLAGRFLEKLLTWKDYGTYNEVRAWLASDCGMAADSEVLTSFLPEIPEDTFGDTNMSYDKAESYTIAEDGENISYFALCSVTNKTDGEIGRGRVAVRYTVDGAGNIGQVSAYTLVK